MGSRGGAPSPCSHQNMPVPIRCTVILRVLTADGGVADAIE
jgi:hypothetical protein